MQAAWPLGYQYRLTRDVIYKLAKVVNGREVSTDVQIFRIWIGLDGCSPVVQISHYAVATIRSLNI